MKLFLLRHAEAEATWPDFERKLTPKGEHSIQRLAQHLDPSIFKDLNAIAHSPLVRAKQTAELFQKHLNLDIPLVETEGLTPEDNPMAIIRTLSSAQNDVILIGHNPYLTLLSHFLLTGNLQNRLFDFKKSGFLCLERLTPAQPNNTGGVWELKSYLTPKFLAK